MSDNPKEANKEMEKAIFISADCWLEVFDLLPPSQLGLGIAIISHRFDYFVDEHFKTRKWKLGDVKIGRKIGQNDANEMEIVNSNGKALPIPQNPLPNKVIGFRRIFITFIDQNVLTFIRRFDRFFATCATKLFIHNKNVRISEFVMFTIWPMLKDTIRTLYLNPSLFIKSANFPRQFSSTVHHFTLSLSVVLEFCPNFRPTTMPMRRMAKRWPNGCSRLVLAICRRDSALRTHRWTNGWQPLNKSKRHFSMLLLLLISAFLFPFLRPFRFLPFCHLN